MTNVQQKKGLGPLAWVGIGCGVLVLIVIIAIVAGGYFVAGKVKDVAQDFKDNPELASARMIVKMNPELEEVSYDEKAGTITVREKKTGKTMTANFEDIKEGKFSLTDDKGETVTFESSQGEEGGSMKVTSEDGSWEVSNETEAKDIPEWIPVPEGGKSSAHSKFDTAEEISGSLLITSTEPVAILTKFYKESLEGKGLTVSSQEFAGGSGDSAILTGIDEAKGRNVTVTIGRDQEVTTCSIIYSTKK